MYIATGSRLCERLTNSYVQKIVSVPTALHDIWHGGKAFCIENALRAANITPEEFDAKWQDKVNSLIETDCGKKRLVQLLEKGGFRAGARGFIGEQLRHEIWFINQVVRCNTDEEARVTTSSSTATNVRICMYLWMHGCDVM